MNNKPKIVQKAGKIAINLMVLASLLLNLAAPTATQAISLTDLGVNLSFFSQKTAEIEDKLPDSGPREPSQVVEVVFTAYSSEVGQTDDSPFIAAWGEHVYDGMIAANWLPHNTKIKIPSLFGDKIFTVADRMNARYGYGRADIWMNSRADAVKFGVQRVEVEIYYVDNTRALAKR